MQKIYFLLALAFFTFSAKAQVTGTKTIGVDYATVAAAVTALNTTGVGAGGATINIPAGYTETVPSGGIVLGTTLLNASLSAANPLTFVKSGAGANPVLTAFTGGTSTTSDGIFKIAGADYVTIDGIDLKENAANTGAALMEWGYALVNLNAAAPFDGVQNLTIKNCKITMDKTNPNASMGIYGGNNIATNATALTLTVAADVHSSDKFYSNTITNAGFGIFIGNFSATAPAAALFGQNNDVGGASAATGNTLTNVSPLAGFNAFGIYMAYQNALNISNNTISGLSAVSGTAITCGLYIFGANGTATTNNNIITVSQGAATGNVAGIYAANTGSTTATGNTITFTDAAGSATHYGVYCPSTGTVNISNNTFRATNTGACTGTYNFVYQSATAAGGATLSNNIFDNINTSTTGTVYLVYASSGTLNITANNNSINGSFTKTGAGGTVYGIYDNGSPGSGTFNFSGNNLSNISLTGATAFYGCFMNTSTSQVVICNNNTVSNVTTGGAAVYGLYPNYGAAGSTVNGNTVTGLSNTATSLYGIQVGSTAPLGMTISGNTISGLTCTGAVVTNGLLVSGGTNLNIYKNKISDLTGNNAGATVNGILIAGAATSLNIYNNLIGNLKAPLSTGAADVIRGISITTAPATTPINVYNNTVYLNASSTGTNFSTSALFATTNATATSGALTLRNNILVNTSTPNGTGFTSAYRRSSATLTNYTNASNNNLFYAGTSCTNSAMFYNGTTAYNTIPTLQAAVTPREANSVTEFNTPFLSTSGFGATFLHLNTATPTVAESGGAPIALVTDDYDGDARNATTPDIGADEMSGSALTACGGTPIAGTITGTHNICQGSNTTLTLTGYSVASGITIQWQSSGTPGGPYTNISCANGVTYNTGVIPTGTTVYYVATVTCANGGGNATTVEFAVTSNPTPTIGVTPSAPGICAGGSGVALTASGASTYTWSPATGLSATTGANVTANPALTTTYTINGISAAGCPGTGSVIVTVNNPPGVPTITPASTSMCAGTVQLLTVAAGGPTTLLSENFNSVAAGAIPAGWTKADGGGSGTVLWGAIASANAGGTANEMQLNCNSSATTDIGVFTLKTPVQNASGVTGVQLAFRYAMNHYSDTYPYTLRVQTSTDNVVWTDRWTVTPTGADANDIPATPVTVNLGAMDNQATFYVRFAFDGNAFGARYWYVDDVVISGTVTGGAVLSPVTGLYTNAAATVPYTGTVVTSVYASPTVTTTYTATATGAGGCTSTSTATVTINTPTAYTVTGGGAFCAGGAGVAVGLSNSETGVSYQLILNGTTNVGSPVAGNTGSAITFGLQTTGGTYTVVGTRSGCNANMNGSVTVTVNPVPVINSTIGQPTTCTSADGTVDLTITGAPGPFSFAWTGPGVVPGSEDQSGLTAGTYNVTVTNTVTNCVSTATINLTGPGGCNICPTIPTLTSNPTPATCIGSTIALTASGLTQMGVTYGIIFKYSATPLANPYSGGTVISTVPNGSLTAGGTQAAASTSFAAAGTYNIYAILTPNPLDPSCRPSATTTVTINPTPTVNAVTNQTVCNSGSTTAITFSGAVAGTVYNWTNNTTSIGLAASGSGNIASFTATNAGTAPVTATITVTPSYTNGGATCTGTPTTFTITVNPTATVNAVTNQTVCNAANTTAVTFSSPTTGGTIVYNWTNNTPSIGLAASGSGNIASFVAANATTAPVTATITVTPSYTNGSVTCTGTPRTFTITVNPVATVNAIANQTVCNNTSTTAVTFSSPTTGGTIVYNWTNNTTSIGLAASGSGNIAAFTAVNTTTSPVTATITVTPSYTNGSVTCTGTPRTFTITVNPTPAATISYAGSPYCSSAGTATVTATGTTGGTFTSTAGLSINASTGAITLGTSTPGTYTVTYTIAAAGGCAAFSTTASVTVTAAPNATIAYAGSPYCIAGGPATVTLTGTTGGTYSSTAGLTINASTGTITPATSTAGTYTVTYSIAAGGGCAAFSTTASVTINSGSTAPTGATASNQFICGNSGTTNLTAVGGVAGSGGLYKWYSGSCGGTLIGTGVTLTNVFVNTTTTFYVRIEGLCGNTSCASVTVNVNPVPVVLLTAGPSTTLTPSVTTGQLVATASPVGNYIYSFTKNGNLIYTGPNNSIPLTSDSTGSYQVSVVNPATTCTAVSNTVVITGLKNSDLFISPNPNKGLFTVRYYADASEIGKERSLSIYDDKGGRVFAKKIIVGAPYTAMDVDLTHSAKGIYMVLVTDAGGKNIASGRVLIAP